MEISYKRRCVVNTRQPALCKRPRPANLASHFKRRVTRHFSFLHRPGCPPDITRLFAPDHTTTSFLRKLSSYRGRDRLQYHSDQTGPPPYSYSSYPYYPNASTAPWPYSAQSTVAPPQAPKKSPRTKSKSRTKMSDTIGKWAPGSSYGPVLSQTDLYLLNPELVVNPILAGANEAFQLQFNLQTGLTGGFNSEARERDLPFAAKDEPATLPRVSELIIITELSPWCTVIKNPQGVTLNDVCQAVWKEYTENYVTDKEFESLTPRVQEHIKRLAASNAAQQSGMYSGYFSPANVPSRFRRVDWLRDKVYFERLLKKDPYIKSRLGYTAPNIFVMALY